VRPVNFVYNRSADYKLVQDQLFDLIERHLQGVDVSRTIEERRDDAINFGVHIRLSRDRRLPMPIDVLMSHGLADKSYFLAAGEDGGRLVNCYEHVIVAGEWFKTRLRLRRWHPLRKKRVILRPAQIQIGGWPRIDRLLSGPSAPVRPGRIRLLWAPSHNRTVREKSFSSYPAFMPFLEPLARDFDVRVSLHPSNRRDKTPTRGDLEWADVVVSDFGTLLYEAWAARKCVIMPRWLMSREITEGRSRYSAEGFVYRKSIGNHARSFEELVQMAKACAPPDQRVEAFMNRILDRRYRGSSGERIARLLLDLPVRRLEPAKTSTGRVADRDPAPCPARDL
jgi:hypothetical protein